jgi:hypothetical protein
LVTLSAIPRVRLQDSAYKSAMLQTPPFNNLPMYAMCDVASEVHDISASILTHACFLSSPCKDQNRICPYPFPFSNSLQVSGRGVLIDFSEDWWRRGVCPLSHSVTPNQPCLIGKPKKGALCFGFALPLYFKHVPLRPLPSMCDVHNLVTLQPNWQTGISYVGSPREVLIVAGMFRCH